MTPAKISNTIHTQTETIFYRETILFFPAQGPTNGPEGMKEAPKRNTELADQPRQGAAANGTFFYYRLLLK